MRCGKEEPEEIEIPSMDSLDAALSDMLDKHHEWRKMGDESKYDGLGIEAFQKAHITYREELDTYIENKIRDWMKIHPPTYQ